MTLPLSDIVDVSINVGPVAAVRTNFNLGLIIGKSAIISTDERVRIYSKLADMTADGWTGLEPEYLAAQLYFSQSPQPNKVAIGVQGSSETAVQAVTACRSANTEWYGCIVCGIEKAEIQQVASYIDSADPASAYFYTTHDEDVVNGVTGNIMDLLQRNNTHRTLGQYSTDSIKTSGYEVGNAGGETDLTAETGNKFNIAVDGDVTPKSITLTLTNCTDGNSTASEIEKQIQAIGGEVYSNVTILYSIDHYVITSPTDGEGSQVRITVDETADISAKLKIGTANGATDIDGTTTYLESAVSIMGYAMGANTETAGSAYTLYCKSEVGVSPEPLTATQVNRIKGYNGNVYINRGSVYNLFENGVMHDGSYFDELINLDMLSNNIQTSILNTFTSLSKVPQTDDGIATLTNAITAPLENARIIGYIAPGVWDSAPILSVNTGDILPRGYSILFDSVSNQSQVDRESRKAPPIYVLIKLAGSIQNVRVGLYINR